MNTFNMAVKRLGKDFLSEEDPHESEPCLYIDLYRVEDGKIAERWGFPEEPPPQEEWKNNNGML